MRFVDPTGTESTPNWLYDVPGGTLLQLVIEYATAIRRFLGFSGAADLALAFELTALAIPGAEPDLDGRMPLLNSRLPAIFGSLAGGGVAHLVGPAGLEEKIETVRDRFFSMRATLSYDRNWRRDSARAERADRVAGASGDRTSAIMPTKPVSWTEEREAESKAARFEHLPGLFLAPFFLPEQPKLMFTVPARSDKDASNKFKVCPVFRYLKGLVVLC
jgi:hypothetical protein